MSSALPSDTVDGLRVHAGPSTLGGALRFFVRQRSPQIIAAIFIVATAVRLYLGRFGVADAVIPVVLLTAWPLIEWCIHTYVLHARPRHIGRWTFHSFAARKHHAHHRDPWRFDILFFPVRVFVWVLPVLTGLLLLIFPPPQAMTGLAFTFGVLLHYEWVHFMSHTRYRPRLAPYQRMWRQHRLHHCKNEKHWMGVTTRVADRILGTLPRKPADVPTSPTCRTLGYAEDLGMNTPVG